MGWVNDLALYPEQRWLIPFPDKYGLVSRFSRVLDENGINHMYSSTVKTANLLVSTTRDY